MNARNFGFFILFLIGLFAFVIISLDPVSAQEKIDNIEIKNVKITPQNDKLEISAVLFNPSQNIETSPFTHLLTLSSIDELFKFRESVTNLPSVPVSAVEGGDYISLKPQEQKMVSFLLPVSQYLPKNNYTLKLAMILASGKALGSYREVIYDLGSNQKTDNLYKDGFLTFDQRSCVIVTTDDREFGNNDGPIFKPSEKPKIRCAVKNVGKEEITVFPNIEWKELFVYGRPSLGEKLVEASNEAIIFKPGEIKTIELSLTAAERPQVYQALLSFIDKNKIVRSYNMPFRWTIGGPSARVEKVALTIPLKSAYEAGETISLSVDYYGSMDLFWGGIDNVSGLRDVRIVAVIKDKKEKICGQAEVALPDINDAGIHNQTVDVKLDKQCAGILYDVSLFSDDKKLANVLDVFPAVIGEGGTAEERSDTIPLIYYIIGAMIFIVIYKIFTIVSRRRHKDDWQKTLLIFLFLTGAILFLANFHTARATSHNDKTLTVQNTSSGGTGTVTGPVGRGDGINCGVNCTEAYANDTVIFLTATPGPSSIVSGWSGGGTDCPLSTDRNTCKTKMGTNRTIKATFVLAYTLTIEPGPGPAPGVPDDGSGTIMEGGSKINCSITGGVASGVCADRYRSGSSVSIYGGMGGTEIKPASKANIFAGWMGDCVRGFDLNDCALTMNSNKTAKAVFRLITSLTKAFTPKIKEYVGSNNSFVGNTEKLFTANSDKIINEEGDFYISEASVIFFNNSISNNMVNIIFNPFLTGCNNGTEIFGRVKMSVGANELAEEQVNFKESGSLGPYTSGDSFDVSLNFEAGYSNVEDRDYKIDPAYLTPLESKTNPYLNIYITAANTPPNVYPLYSRRGFFGFSYTDAYNFNVDLNQFGAVADWYPAPEAYDASDVIKIKIPLVFPSPSRTLNVTSVNGTVTGPAGTGDGINCGTGGSDCSEAYSDGATVTLTAIPDAGVSVFSNWSGDCSGATCSLSMNANKSVTANFGLLPVASFTATPTTGPAPLTVQFTDTSTNNPTSWSWDLNGNGILGDRTTQNPTWTYTIPNRTPTISLMASNIFGSDIATMSITITANQAPIISVGPQHTLDITPPTTPHIHSGASATDPESSPMTYTWSWVSCPGVPPCSTLTGNSGSVIGGSIAGPTYTPDEAGTYNLQLSVSDGTNLVTAPLAEVTNTPPTITSLGSDTITVNDLHIHSGAAATDLDGASSDLNNYQWSWVSYPGALPALTDDSGGINGSLASIAGPAYTPNAIGDYILKLTVTDDMGATAEATLTETAGPSTPSFWWDLFRILWKEKK